MNPAMQHTRRALNRCRADLGRGYRGLCWLVPILLISIVSVELASADTEGFTVAPRADMDRYGKITDNIRRQCEIDRFVNTSIAKYNANVTISDDPVEGTGRIEVVVFVAMRAPTTIVGVHGRLVTDGVLTGSFRGSRTFQLDPFAYRFGSVGGGGTCGIMNRIGRRLGEDIAEFLKHPSLGATIGD